MRSATLMFVILLTTSPVSAKMYKWVDDEGNVTYSQTPPPADSNIEKQDIKVSGQTVKPHKKGKYLYCGKSRLPKVSERVDSAVSMLEENIIGWKDSNTNIKEQRGEYTKKNSKDFNTKRYTDRIKSYDNRIKENSCKIEWAKSELTNLEDDKTKIYENYDNLGKAIKELEREKVLSCGSNNYEGIVVMNDESREYFKCIKKFDREIKKIEKKLRTVKRQKEVIDNY